MTHLKAHYMPMIDALNSCSFETLILSEPVPFVIQMTLNRPGASNALNTRMGKDLFEVFEAVSLDPVQTRCIVLTGAGEKAFCAGGDLKERNGMSDEAWGHQHRIFERMLRAILDCPVPVIAAVNGAAYGGGCEIAAACDFVYAADTARFAQTETRLGIIPGAGGTQTLARAVGERRAKELIFSARAFTAEEAAQWGLVNQVHALADLSAAALATATEISANAPIAVRQAKQSVHRGLQMSLSDGLWFEIEAYNRTVGTDDRHEGVRAFNEKRLPDFKGK